MLNSEWRCGCLREPKRADRLVPDLADSLTGSSTTLDPGSGKSGILTPKRADLGPILLGVGAGVVRVGEGVGVGSGVGTGAIGAVSWMNTGSGELEPSTESEDSP